MSNHVSQQELDPTEVEIVPVENEVAPETAMFADWPTYEVVPGGE